MGHVSNVPNCCKPLSHGTLETCPTCQRLLPFRNFTIKAKALLVAPTLASYVAQAAEDRHINPCRVFKVVITFRRDAMSSRRSVTTTILPTLIDALVA